MRDIAPSFTSLDLSESQVAASLDDALFARITRRTIPLLFFCYLIAQIDRMNIGFAKLTMMNDLGFDDMIYGFGAGIFFIGYVLFEVPSNLLVPRYGAPAWIGRIMISWGILSTAMLFVRSEASFYALRFLIGVAEAGFFPAVIYYLTFWFPIERRARITALFMSAIALSGVVVGPVSGSVLQTMDGLAGLKGWQWLFVIEGLPAILLGLIVMTSLDRGPDSATWLSIAERDRLAALMAAEPALVHTPLLAALSHPRVLLCSLVYGCYGMSFFGFVFWLPTIIQTAGVGSPLAIGILSTIPWLAGAATMLILSPRVHGRSVRIALIGLALASAAGWAASPAAPGNLPVAMTLCSLAMAGTMGSLPIFWNLPTGMFSGVAAAGAIALITALGNIPGFLSPYIVGWIKQSTGAFALPMYMFAATMLLAAIVIAHLTRRPVDV